MNEAKNMDSKKLEELISKLTQGQLDRLQGLFNIRLDILNGDAEEVDAMRYILDLPKEDVSPFTEIMELLANKQ